MKYAIRMKLYKETKGALRYEEEGSEVDKIGTLYVRKDGMSGETPETITVTVES